MSITKQITLTVTDERVVREVIEPFVSEKKLNKLLCSLLSLFCYEEDIKRRVLDSQKYDRSSALNEILSSLELMRDNLDSVEYFNEEMRISAKEGIDIFSSDEEFSPPDIYNRDSDIKLLISSNEELMTKNILLEKQIESVLSGQDRLLELLNSLVSSGDIGSFTVSSGKAEVIEEKVAPKVVEENKVVGETTDVVKPDAVNGDDVAEDVDSEAVFASLMSSFDF